MGFKHSVKKTVLLPAAAAAVLAAMLWPSSSVSASTEQATAGAAMPAVTLAQNSSYVSDAYAGVLNVEAGDSAVACASADSQNRLVVTAVGTGSTTVTFWYKSTTADGWVSTSMPVKVTAAASSQANAVQAGTYGFTFAPASATIGVGSTVTPQGIRVSGFSVSASSLLWVSSSDAIATVDKSTGLITGVGKGAAVVYAVDPATKLCGAYSVTVN
mgnify:CR=1 FL=1